MDFFELKGGEPQSAGDLRSQRPRCFFFPTQHKAAEEHGGQVLRLSRQSSLGRGALGSGRKVHPRFGFPPSGLLL